MRKREIERLVGRHGLAPVLVDIGASADPPACWRDIAFFSTYLGFDADSREIDVSLKHFKRAEMIPQALVAEPDKKSVLFYLTHSPFCSSTLLPDTDALSNYLFSDLFVVESKAESPATCLNDVMDRLSLDRIDWLKTDSQGTDLRLITSLRDDLRNSILAVDIEPGLMDAYVGEDLFTQAHEYLINNGFWLADMVVKGSVRMNRDHISLLSSLDSEIDAKYLETHIPNSPGWCEARYFRTMDWMKQTVRKKEDYVLLWLFCAASGQLGFCTEVAVEYMNRFGKNETFDLLMGQTVRAIKQAPVIRTNTRWEGLKCYVEEILHAGSKGGQNH